jgi:hypothetical protein
MMFRSSSRLCGPLLQIGVFAVIATQLLFFGCRWITGMRSESSTRFVAPRSGIPFQECLPNEPTLPPTFEVGQRRRGESANWVPGVGGVVLTGDRDKYFGHQELFALSGTGSIKKLLSPPFPSAISEAHFMAGSEPLLILGEVGGRQSWLSRHLGFPHPGDLVVMDLAGVQRARHKSAYEVVVSPDSQWLAFWRSNGEHLHNLFVARPEQDEDSFVASIVEADPGSGRSFYACWSSDSRYLHVSGASKGWKEFRWTYDADSGELYAEGG